MTREEKYKTTDTFIYYNANPKNRITGDCVKRAFCTAMDIPYNTVVMEMAELHCETGHDPSYNIGIYPERKGWIKHAQPRKADNTKYTGSEFCKYLTEKYPHGEIGSIIANIGGHHTICIKWIFGKYKVHDIWNSTKGCIGNYWTRRV